MILYRQSFYRIHGGSDTGGVDEAGAEKRAQMAKATLALCRLDDIIIATCTGGRDATEPLEISLVLQSHEDANTLTPQIQKALAEQGFTAQVTMQEDVRYHTFGEEQLENIKQASHLEDVESAYRVIDAFCAAPIQRVVPGSCTAVSDHTHIPSSQIDEPFSVTQMKYERMKIATESEIEDEIRGLLAAFEALSTETNTNAAVVTMIANGLLTVGNQMWRTYLTIPWGGSISTWLGDLINAAGGIPVLAHVSVTIVAVFAMLFILLKDVRNGLVFLNGESCDIELIHDCLLHGDRKSVVTTLPAMCSSLPKPPAYPCGMYVYKKHAIFSSPQLPTDHTHPAFPVAPSAEFPIGFYGSTVGLAFRRANDGECFSIGLDSPFLERNSVCVIAGDDPKRAAEIADDTATTEGSLTIGESTCTIRHASEWGNVNVSICTLDKAIPSPPIHVHSVDSEIVPSME